MKKLPSKEKRYIKQKSAVIQAFEELQRNHDHSWYKEIIRRNRNLDKEAVFYRGTRISYGMMIKKADDLAEVLRTFGIQKGKEIVVCMSNIPELIYLLLAANRIGAVLNLISKDFDKEYLRMICNMSNSEILFVSDDVFYDLDKKIDRKRFKNCVVASLTDSLENGIDPFLELDNDFYEFKNHALKIKSEHPSVFLWDEFMNMEKQKLSEDESIGLDTDFTITYTSGSTKIGWPKAIIHSNRSYIYMGRFHDKDLSRLPPTENLRSLVQIPIHTNTSLASCISDIFMQSCSLALEPIYDEYFFARSLVINKPHFAAATRSFWIRAMKMFRKDEKLLDSTLPDLVIPASVGENISINEEKYINQSLKRLKAGKNKLPAFLGTATISVGGGNCEHGGLFFTLLKGTREKITGKDYGMIPFQLAELAVLKEDGTECAYNELGILAANSPCTMKGYKGNLEETNKFFIRDAYGRIWGNCNVWAYLDKKGRIHMRGRIGNEIMINHRLVPLFMIDEIVLKNKSVMSCETVLNIQNRIVSFIELFPESKESKEELKRQIIQAVNKYFHHDVTEYLVYILSEDVSYQLTKSGKRNIVCLENMAL